MPRRGENIYKRKDGRWEARYISGHDSNGKAMYTSLYARTYKDVKEKLDKYGLSQSASQREHTQSPKYGDILADWLSDKKNSVKESTFSRYHNLIRHYILPHFGDMTVENIGNAELEDFIALLRSEKYGSSQAGLSGKTIADIMSVLKNSLRYANKHNYRISCQLDEVTVRKSHSELRVLSHAEQKRLVKVCSENIDSKKIGIMLCLFTGIRIGELCALKWEDVDFSERLLKIRHTVQRIQNPTNVEKRTKIITSLPKSSSSIRDIPIPDCLYNYLLQNQKDGCVYIASEKTDKPSEPRVMQYYFQYCLEQCGIEHVNFHALRHTFATRCVEVGFDIKSLSEILGHSNVNITLNRYIHSSLEQKRTNMQRLVLI